MSGIVVGIEDVTENKIDKVFLSLGVYMVVDGREITTTTKVICLVL